MRPHGLVRVLSFPHVIGQLQILAVPSFFVELQQAPHQEVCSGAGIIYCTVLYFLLPPLIRDNFILSHCLLHPGSN
jgi:hypothetical protein